MKCMVTMIILILIILLEQNHSTKCVYKSKLINSFSEGIVSHILVEKMESIVIYKKNEL